MVIIFNVFLDLAPCAEVIFNISPMASQWPQSPRPLNGPIGLRSVNNWPRDPVLKLELKILSLLESHVWGIRSLQEPGNGLLLSYVIYSSCHQNQSSYPENSVLSSG